MREDVTTIICLGNDMRGDDGAGPAVAERLWARGIAARVEQPADLLDAWAGADDVVVVDAVRSGAAPGAVHRIDAGEAALPAGWESGSTHLIGLSDAIELARALGRLPARLRVVGIEGRRFGYGEPLSAEVEQAAAEIADELARLPGAAAVGRS